MTLRWINKQGVESTDGYVLQRMDRYFYHYLEGGHAIKLLVEPGLKAENIALSSINRWQPPHENEELSDEKIKVIKSNIVESLKFMGIKFKSQ